MQGTIVSKFIPPLAVCPADGARMLGIGRTRFYELLKADEIKSFTLGRRRLVKVSELESWLDRVSAA